MKDKKEILRKELISFMSKNEINARTAAKLIGYKNQEYIYSKRCGTHNVTESDVSELKKNYFFFLKNKLEKLHKELIEQGFLL